MGVLPKLFKLWPWVVLDPFYAKVKFGHIGFCRGKSENYLFFGNYCSLGSQSCLKHLAKWVNEVVWVSKVKVILWPCSKVTQISKLKLVFLKNSRVIWNQSWYESLRGNRNRIYTNGLGHMTKMAVMPIYGKNHSLTLVKGHSDFKVKTFFLQKQLDHSKPKLIWKLKTEWVWKLTQISWVTWPTWPPCPYMVKTLKNHLQNQ